MRALRLGTAVLVFLTATTVAAEAQTAGRLRWDGVGNSFVNTYRRGGSSVSVYGGSSYKARLNINSPTWGLPPSGQNGAFGPSVDIYCVDFLHAANTGTYNVWFTRLGVDAMSRTRSNNVESYLKAAWLIQQMDIKPITDQVARSDIHAAIWHMMSGQPTSVRHGSTWTAVGMNTWIAAANANWNDGSVRAGEWSVVTDACVSAGGTAGAGHDNVPSDNCAQEFLTRNVVPEPATVILLGTGLLATLALTGVMRRPEA